MNRFVHGIKQDTPISILLVWYIAYHCRYCTRHLHTHIHKARQKTPLYLTRGVGEAEGGDARAGLHEEAVGVAVVAAIELDDLLATGEGTDETKHAHARLQKTRHK